MITIVIEIILYECIFYQKGIIKKVTGSYSINLIIRKRKDFSISKINTIFFTKQKIHESLNPPKWAFVLLSYLSISLLVDSRKSDAWYSDVNKIRVYRSSTNLICKVENARISLKTSWISICFLWWKKNHWNNFDTILRYWL